MMKAAFLTGIPSNALALRETPRPVLKAPGQVLVQVEACGICATDLHVLDGHSFKPDPPFVLGHEPVGTVVDVYSPSDAAWLNRRVTSNPFEGCGTCEVCRGGDERLCLRPSSVLGLLGAQGGYADEMVMSAPRLVEVPNRLEAIPAASLVDSGSTAANAVRIGSTKGKERAVVLGGGPIGFLVAELLRAEGTDAVVVEPNTRRRDVLASGGHSVVSDTADLGIVPDLVYECSANPEAFRWAVEALTPHGVLLAVGFPVLREFTLLPVIRKQLQIQGVRSGSMTDLEKILVLASSHQIELPPIETFALSEINRALDAMRGGHVVGKAVVDLAQ